MDANSGEPWSKMDLDDLKASLAFGNRIAATANMLCRDEDEVREGERTWAGRMYPDRPLEPAPHGDQQDTATAKPLALWSARVIGPLTVIDQNQRMLSGPLPVS
jgi:hypothetical protein